MFVMNQISYWTLPLSEMEPMDEKLRTIVVRPGHPAIDSSRMAGPIEHPDSWQKIRGTGAIVDRENVGVGLEAFTAGAGSHNSKMSRFGL
jgi:hypothetical protein